MSMTRYCVYRFYDDQDELLYVGRTVRIASRVSTHRREKDWWLQVDRIEISHCATRDEMVALELRLIHELGPRYNVHGRPSATLPQAAERPLPPVEIPAQYATLDDLASHLAIPSHLLRRHAIDTGELEAGTVEGVTVIHWDAIEAWLETKRVVPAIA